MQTTIKSEPYTILAEVYNDVMAKVDYELWADFIDEVIQNHHPCPDHILELACGTGSLTFEMEKLGYKITAGDKSPQMLEKARKKAIRINSNVQFKQLDFLDIPLEQTFDVVVSVFDSVNYLLDEASLLHMFAQAKKVMNKDSLFIFDFTTPQNSLQSTRFLDNKKGAVNGCRYVRKSWYDDERQIHYNSFEIEKKTDNGRIERFSEAHKQRTYTLHQIKHIIAKTDFAVKAAYGEFDMSEADENSFRITMVVQCHSTQ